MQTNQARLDEPRPDQIVSTDQVAKGRYSRLPWDVPKAHLVPNTCAKVVKMKPEMAPGVPD